MIPRRLHIHLCFAVFMAIATHSLWTAAARADAARPENDAAAESANTDAEQDAEPETREPEPTNLGEQFLQGPLAPHRIWDWLADVGPKVLVILIVMAVLWRLSRVVSHRIVGRLILRSHPGEKFERQQRADTLQRVFQRTAGLVIVVFAILAVLDASGIDVTVLLGGAAVIGAAVAFGSQNLIKDFFSGFMILLENQYSVGNIIRIADATGVVEDITLRMTVLRDEEGVAHFIPHGQITMVSNLTHGWSRAVLRIGVGYDEDADRVMAALMEVARELQADDQFGQHIVGEPEMQGVDSFGDSAVVIKLLVTTRPRKQWAVKRELLRRIKRKFDELGIEIPFPQVVMHRRDEPGEAGEANDVGAKAD